MHLYTDLRKGGISDDPNDLLNYRVVNKAVIRHVEDSHYKTLEALATNIARLLLWNVAYRVSGWKCINPARCVLRTM